MTTNTTTALRALTQHIDRHQLDSDDSIMRAGLVDTNRLDVQIYAEPGADMRALLARWADTIDGAAITAKPVQSSFHVTVAGTVGGFPITLVCVASGERADRIRGALGLVAVTTWPAGDALLDALTSQPAVA